MIAGIWGEMNESDPLNVLSANVGAARRDDPKQWSPPFCGDIDMEIRRDGQWFYRGTAINRHELVKLFARVLRKEGSEYFLVTPVEKVRIRVEDAPFLVVDVEVSQPGQGLQRIDFLTSLGESFALNAAHPLRVSGEPGMMRPYVHVRDDLWALLSRSAYYRLADYAQAMPGAPDQFGINSLGLWYLLP